MPTSQSRPDNGRVEKLITFLYYKDLAAAMRFYEDIMGFSVAIDQGWCKIYGISSEDRKSVV